MENKAYNEYIAQLDKISDLIKKTNKISNNSTSTESYLGSRNLKGQPHGSGTLTNSEGIRFTGNWINGVLSGNGSIEYIDGIYEGDIKDFKQHGKGKLTSSNGDIYEGEWENGLKHGKGKYVWNNGNSYQGDWAQDKQEGNGVENSKNGTIIKEGRWKKGVCILINAGDSVQIKIEGSFGKGIFTGSLINGKPNGFGKADYDNGQYEGEWKNGKKEGIGKFTWKAGNIGHVFNGKWVNDIRDGFGKQIYANGDIYEGEWKDKRYGKGKMTYADGTVFDGEWKDGKKEGSGKERRKNGSYIDGEWANNELMNGNGKIIDDDVSYTGEFGAGYTLLEGKIVSPMGFSEGTFDEDCNLVNGYKKSKSFEGEWRNGQIANGRYHPPFGDFMWIEGSFSELNLIGEGKAKFKKDGHIRTVYGNGEGEIQYYE